MFEFFKTIETEGQKGELRYRFSEENFQFLDLNDNLLLETEEIRQFLQFEFVENLHFINLKNTLFKDKCIDQLIYKGNVCEDGPISKEDSLPKRKFKNLKRIRLAGCALDPRDLSDFI